MRANHHALRRLLPSSYTPLCPCSRCRSGASTPAGEPRSPVRMRHQASRRSDRTSPQLAAASSPGTTAAPSPSPSSPVSHAAPPLSPGHWSKPDPPPAISRNRRELGLQATAAPAGMLWPRLGLLPGKPSAPLDAVDAGQPPCASAPPPLLLHPTLPLLALPQRSVHARRRAPQPRAHAPPSLAPLRPDFPAARRRQFTEHHRSPLSLSFLPCLSRSSPSLSRTLVEAGSAAGH
nr:vegetative cell wall protein gp1-like [Aegilops tauschii subsp. strangulata]